MSNLHTGSYAPVNGLQMYYEIHGSGEPLVLIHGGGSTIHTTFGNVLNTLSVSHKVIAVEMQAHGRTLDIDRELSFEHDADDIATLLDYLNIKSASVFGFSNGACTTLQLAIRHAKLVNRIIVASTFYKKTGAPDWFWPMMSSATYDAMPNAYKRAFLEVNPDTQALLQMYKRDVARMLNYPDIANETIATIKAPALVILGDRDVVTPAHAAEMCTYLQNARLVVLPCGHGDYIGEATTPYDQSLIDNTIRLVQQFLHGDL